MRERHQIITSQWPSFASHTLRLMGFMHYTGLRHLHSHERPSITEMQATEGIKHATQGEPFVALFRDARAIGPVPSAANHEAQEVLICSACEAQQTNVRQRPM